MSAVLRILDANANRAREALRVMEEAARFLLDEQALTETAKSLRHDLAAALASVPGLEAARDTPGDVGTAITAESEVARASTGEVVTTAGKRLSEALRAMEEYAKTLPAVEAGETPLAATLERLRYRGYDLEHRLTLALGSGRARQWRLCVLLSEALCAHWDWLTVARECLEAGADCLQLREKELEAGPLLERARALVELAHPAGASVIINDRPDVALLSGADGLHLGQQDLPPDEARRLVGQQLLLGLSTANLDHARRALAGGADYCGVGPMFATRTKDKEHLAGPEYLRAYRQWDRLPHLAIGGITPENAPQLVAAGACGLAVSGCVCGAERPAEVVNRLLSAFD